MKQLVCEITILQYYQPSEELLYNGMHLKKAWEQLFPKMESCLRFGRRALSRTEVNYAQIEKELLVVFFGLEKFRQYTYGRPEQVQSGHKPLESIIRKPLHMAPRRLQRMLLRLQGYDIDLVHRSG